MMMMTARGIRVSKFNNLYSISESHLLLSSYSSFGRDSSDDYDRDRPPNRLSRDGSSRHDRRPPSYSQSNELNDAGGDDDGNYQGRRQNHNRFNPNQQPPRRQGFSSREIKDFGHSDGDGNRRYGLSNRSSYEHDFSNAPRINKMDGGKSGNLFPSSEEEEEGNAHKLTSKEQEQQPIPHSAEDHSFLEKFRLGFDHSSKKKPSHSNEAGAAEPSPQPPPPPPPQPPEDAEEIFKKMKETGLIPNAVAMLHGLCNDGLVHEAMKLFGLMREKGTIPEVVIYTAVVEGFCKAQKLEDAKRIFRKMQNNGISPNAFSYLVLIQGLCRGSYLDDALEFSLEMLEAGHSPNLVTFTGLVDGFCRERGREAAEAMIATLRRKGFLLDDKAAKEFMAKNGTFSPLVWEAIFGIKKSSPRPF